MNKDIYYYRTELLITFDEKKYSQDSKHNMMHLFGKLDPGLKELVAKELIPLVQSSNSEQEASKIVEKIIAKYVEEMNNDKRNSSK